MQGVFYRMPSHKSSLQSQVGRVQLQNQLQELSGVVGELLQNEHINAIFKEIDPGGGHSIACL